MWILECDGDVLGGKRIWLRPGKRYLFGRTSTRGDVKGKGFQVNDNSISRKHMSLALSMPESGHSNSPKARSLLILKDENSKQGTVVDGELLINDSRTLTADEHIFKLGKVDVEFSIKWKPVVISFKPSSKDAKGQQDPLALKRALLEPLDIKVLSRYVSGQTTHVVSNKRNTPQSLRALVHGDHLVDESFLKELEYATAEGDMNEPESLSPLEADFDAAWPDALKCLPLPSKEPNQRPAELFAPDLERRTVFEGCTFVFFNEKQFDGLQPAITDGGGKAQNLEVKPGITTGEDIARLVKDAAGEEGIGELGTQGSGKGVIQIRFPGEGEFQDWADDVQRASMLITGLSVVEQNELLDVILVKDTSTLRRPAIRNDSESSARLDTPAISSIRATQSQAPPTSGQRTSAQPRLIQQGSASQVASTQHQLSQSVPSENERSQVEHNQQSMSTSQPAQASESAPRPLRRGRLRGNVVSAFRGFVDVDAVSSGPFVESQASEAPQRTVLTQNGVAQNDSMDVDVRDDSVQEDDVSRNERKRSRTVTEQDDEDFEKELFPAHAAAKRQKLLEDDEEDQPKHVKVSPATKEKEKLKREAERKNKQEQINVKEAARKRREKEEEANREDEEPMQEQLAKMTVDDMQNLVAVEEIEIKQKTGEAQRNRAHDDRWDDRWNGRKNFKKFRRKGQTEAYNRAPTVIVALEEVRDSRHGVQDDFFTTADRPPSRRKGKSRLEREDTTPSQSYADAPSHQEEVPAELLNDDEPEVIDVDAPRATRASGRASQVSSRSRGNKRAATDNAAGPSKKQKKLILPTHSEESSEPEEIPKFKFRRK